MGVMSHLDGLKNKKALNKTKKRLKPPYSSSLPPSLPSSPPPFFLRRTASQR